MVWEKGNPDTKWDYFFLLSFSIPTFKCNWGPVLCHELPHGSEHLLMCHLLTDFPSFGKARETREHATAERDSNVFGLPDDTEENQENSIFCLEG